MFEDRLVLVTGGTGFLGRAVVAALLDRGARVRATHLTREPVLDHPRLEWIRANLVEESDCRAATAGADFVFHLAAVTSGAADIVARPLIHVTPNVVMNARLLEAAYGNAVRKFLFVSTGAVYPPRGDHPLSEDDVFSGEPADVYFPAAWMKRYAEVLCRTYAEELSPTMATVVVRPSNVYGPGDKFDWQRSHVTAALIRRVVERHRPIVVWGTGDDVRDLIYVDDFVAGALAAFAADQPHLTVNIASGEGHTIRDILRTALDVDGFDDAEVTFDPSRPRTVDKLTFDVGKARQTLGFEATTPLPEGLRKTIAWLRANPPAG